MNVLVLIFSSSKGLGADLLAERRWLDGPDLDVKNPSKESCETLLSSH